MWYYFNMSYYGRRYTKYDFYVGLAAFVVVAMVKFWVYYPTLCTIIALVIISLTVFGGNWLIDRDNKNSIKNVRLSLVKGLDTIGNAHCTVKFAPDDKLIVMENIPRNNQKQMFTLLKKDGYKVNKLWSEVCRIFDDYSNVRTLSLLLDVPNSQIVTLESKARPIETPPKPQTSARQINIDNSNIGPKFVEMGAIVPDRFGVGGNVQNKGSEDFVNLDNINKANPVTERTQQEPEFVEMKDAFAVTSTKIDVNSVQAPELAVLPGINIVQAKKLVEHRNINGLFKSVEEFIQVANVKPHFVSKIKSMIVANSINNNSNDDDNYEGRIVDF